MSPVRAIERFIFGPEDARRLAAMRIALFGLVAIRLATNGDYGKVADQPPDLFDPVSLFHLLPSMPSSGMTTSAQVVGVIAALLAASGLWPRASFPTAFAFALFLNLMLNSTGKIVHNDLVVTLCLVPLLATPRAASRAWVVSLRRPQASSENRFGVAYGWPIRTAMVIIGLSYLFVGLQKMRYSGFDWFTTDNLRFVLWQSSDSQASPNSLALFVANRDWIAHFFAAATIITELGFVLCLPFARLRWIFVPAVVGLHVGIWLAMGLDYLPQAAAVIIVFVNWAAISDWLGRSSFGGSDSIRKAAT